MTLLILLITTSFAEDRKVEYQKRVEIDFEALDITGEMIKPQGTIIIERQNTRFPPVMQPRLDFNLEMSESIREIK